MKNGALRELATDLDLQTDLWWLATLFSGLMGTMLAAVAFPGAGAFWAWLTVLVRFAVVLCLAQQPWGTVFARLLPLGVGVGVFAIFPDWLMVNGSPGGARLYPGAPALLASPLYLPLWWALAVVEMGYPAIRFHGLVARRWPGETGMGLTMIFTGAVAAVLTVATDSWAVMAGWWSYRGEYVSVGDTGAVYVVVTQFFSFLVFPLVFVRYLACGQGRLHAAVRYGIVFAGAVFASLVLARLFVEKSFL